MKSTGAGFTRDAVNTVGEKVARALRGALWYIDTAHQQFEERAIHLPDSFKAFQGFNDYSKPRMNVAELSQHCEALAGLLMFPSLSGSNCKKLKADIEQLCHCLGAYSTYLQKHNEKQQEVHSSPVPLRDPAVDSVAAVIEASIVTPPYRELQLHLDAVSLYEPICIHEFAPVDCFLHRTYINKLSLSVDVYMYRMAYGGSNGTLTFIWKIDRSLSDHEEQNAHALVKVTESLPKYAT